MKMPTRSHARILRKRGLHAGLAAAFLFAGVGAQLAAASSAEARIFYHTVYVGDGIYCTYTGEWPFWSCS
jgi:hypothetical protein